MYEADFHTQPQICSVWDRWRVCLPFGQLGSQAPYLTYERASPHGFQCVILSLQLEPVASDPRMELRSYWKVGPDAKVRKLGLFFVTTQVFRAGSIVAPVGKDLFDPCFKSDSMTKSC